MSDKNLEQNSDQGSFSSGMMVGFLAGAVGYFLAKTKEGQAMRSEFTDHWHDLKGNLIKEGKLKESEAGVADYINAIRNKIGGFLGEHIDEKSVTKKSTKKKPAKARKKKIFKGL